MPLYRGTFYLKSAELLVPVFEIRAESWVPFGEKCRIMGSILGKKLQNQYEGNLALIK